MGGGPLRRSAAAVPKRAMMTSETDFLLLLIWEYACEQRIRKSYCDYVPIVGLFAS